VGFTPFDVRINSVADSSTSSARNILVKAGCEMFKRRAAPRKLPSSMAATKAVSDASFIIL
jgi:hypothetical protein